MKIFALCAASAAAFTAQPTGGKFISFFFEFFLILKISFLGVRPCEYYKITATANFDLGAGSGAGALTFVQDGCDDKVKISTDGDLRFYNSVEDKVLDNEQNMYKGVSLGFHVHATGIQVAGSCGKDSTGGHFNPFEAPPGHFDNNRKNREVGQIGEVFCDGKYG